MPKRHHTLDKEKRRQAREIQPVVELWQMATGSFLTQAIYVAARLHIADHLADGPMTVEELAKVSGSNAQSLYRLMRMLASVGIFTEIRDGQFQLTQLSQPMRSNVPSSIAEGLRLLGRPFYWDSWGSLEHSVRTGEAAFENIHGMPFFDYLSGNPEDSAAFYAWMARISINSTPALVGGHNYSQYNTIMDVGGGGGALITGILSANPEVQGIYFDLPHVAEIARERVQTAGVEARCRIVSGDFFESIPAGADAFIMKTIISDWGDEPARAILKNCAAAMSGASKLLIMEAVVPHGNAAHPSKIMDINKLIFNYGGKERTEEQYAELLESSGLRVVRSLHTETPLSIIEAVRRD